MLEPWNNSSILPPPVNMFLCVKEIDIFLLKNVCSNIIKVLSKQSPLHKESALCSRFLYKYDRKFRNDIGYRNFKKVHTALKKYLALNLLKDIESFLSALPSENDDEKYLPTKQMLEFIMLRIITFSMIMLRVCVCSKQAAIFYLNRIKRGEGHWMSLLPYALLSRLWSLSMVLVQHSTNWYSNLYPYLNELELKGLKFLPDNYELPENLEQWLDLKNVDNFGRFDWNQRKLTDDAGVSLDHDDDENDLLGNILNFVNQSNKNESEEEMEEDFKPRDTFKEYHLDVVSAVTNNDQGEKLSRESFKIDHGTVLSRESFKNDQGEALSRESFKVLLSNQNKDSKVSTQYSKERNKTAQQKELASKRVTQITDLDKSNKITTQENDHSHKKVTNATSLKEFINKEEKYRNECDNRSLTNHLSFMQWHALKNALVKLCDALTNRKIERKFQNIWKQKCLDYK